MPKITPKDLVERGYDKKAEEYLRKYRSSSDADKNTKKYLKKLVGLLARGSKILDLGCGAGIPVAKFLSQFYKVVGVDISTRQIELAKKNVPKAVFIRKDITKVSFPPGSFDAVVSFYTIIHIPREQHKEILKKIYKMLKPGGYFLGTMGVEELREIIEEDWLGEPMYWSHFGKEENIKMFKKVGFDILIAKVEKEKENNEIIKHLYVLAQK